MTKTWHNDISDPIPTDIDPKAVISILHDHGFLITMSPIVTRYEEAGREPSTVEFHSIAGATNPGLSDKVHYDVWENIDVLPGGLWKHEISFKCAFENQPDGVVTWIQAPMGLTSQATYRVKEVAGEGAIRSGWILEESIDSSCNVLLKGFVEKTMVNTRKESHARIMEKARERN